MESKNIMLRVSTKYKAKGQTSSDFGGLGKSTITAALSFETNANGQVINFHDGGGGFMKYEYFDIIKLFDISRNELVFETEGTEFSRIHNAVYQGNLEEVKKQLEAGIDINLKMPDGDTPLLMAINCSQNEIAIFLIDSGAGIEVGNFNKQTPLIACVAMGNVTILKKLIAKKVNLNHQDIIGQTAIHLAVGSGNIEIITELLSYKKAVNLNLQTDQGATALHYATEQNNLVLVETLLQNGASIDLEDDLGLTPYALAVKRSYTNIAKLMEVKPNEEFKTQSISISKAERILDAFKNLNLTGYALVSVDSIENIAIKPLFEVTRNSVGGRINKVEIIYDDKTVLKDCEIIDELFLVIPKEHVGKRMDRVRVPIDQRLLSASIGNVMRHKMISPAKPKAVSPPLKSRVIENENKLISKKPWWKF